MNEASRWFRIIEKTFVSNARGHVE